MRRYNLPKPKGESKNGKKRSKNSKDTTVSLNNLARYESMMAELDNPPLSCLHVAVICNAPEVVASLLLKGAQPDRPLAGGLMPLHCLFLNTFPPSEDYYPHLSNQAYNPVNFKTIINHLVRAGSRLSPDLFGLSPLTLALWRRCSIICSLLSATASCSVGDVIQLLYFSMSYNFCATNTLKHSARLKKALTAHLKHGVTPHKSPIDTTRDLMTSLSATNLEDCFEVYSSQLTSYLALQSTPGAQLFPGVKMLLQESVKAAANELCLMNYFPLVSSLIRWLNLHTSLPSTETNSCWELISKSLAFREVRENICILVPEIDFFLHKFVLPFIAEHDDARTIGYVILFLKIVRDSPDPELIPRQEMRDMFHLFNRKHMVLASLLDYKSIMWNFVDKIELLDFAMSFMFNLNESIHGFGGTALHVAARNGDAELIRYFLRAGVSPLIRDVSGHTFLTVLDCSYSQISRDICKEFSLGPPYRLILLCTRVYIRNRIPLKYIHKNKMLLEFVVNHCTRQECRQMCFHCYKCYL